MLEPLPCLQSCTESVQIRSQHFPTRLSRSNLWSTIVLTLWQTVWELLHTCQFYLINEFRCYEAKIEESEKGRQPPGVEPRTPLAWATSAVPLSHDNWTTKWTLVPRLLAVQCTGNEASEHKQVLGVHICPVSAISIIPYQKWWTIPMLNGAGTHITDRLTKGQNQSLSLCMHAYSRRVIIYNWNNN